MSAKILVVEDEPAIAESVAYALRRDGFAVTIAQTLAEAEARRKDADLVILDLMLPDGSGFEWISALRSERRDQCHQRTGESQPLVASNTGGRQHSHQSAVRRRDHIHMPSPY